MTDLVELSQDEYIDLMTRANGLPGVWHNVGWDAPGDLTFEQWLEVGDALSLAQGSIHWWIGDWIIAGENRWGEKYAQALDKTRFVYGTLNNDVWVASRIPFSYRNEKLSWTHHYRVAALPLEEAVTFLEKAETEEWSTRKLGNEIKEWNETNHPELIRSVSGTGDSSQLPLHSTPPSAFTDDMTIPMDLPAPQQDKLPWKHYCKRFWLYYRAWRNRAIRAEQELDILRAENKIQFEEIMALQQELNKEPEYAITDVDWKAGVLLE